MKRLVVLAVLAALVAVAASTALGRNARPNATAACAKGAVAARIGGKAVCLHARMACKAAYNSIYKRHGFTCVAGHLRKTPAAKPKPKPPAPTPTPPPSLRTRRRPGRSVRPTRRSPSNCSTSNPRLHRSLSDDDPVGHGHVRDHEQVHRGPCSFDLEGVKAGAILNNTGESETWTVGSPPASTATTATSIRAA